MRRASKAGVIMPQINPTAAYLKKPVVNTGNNGIKRGKCGAGKPVQYHFKVCSSRQFLT